MSYKYTIFGGEVDDLLDRQLKNIVDEIIINLPEVSSIYLTGGFGRGEGSVKVIRGTNGITVYPLKDFDIILIMNGKVSLKRVNETKKIIDTKILGNKSQGLYHYTAFTIDLNFSTLERCNLLPDITTYELKVASHLLYGIDIRPEINIGINDIQLRTGARILFQKAISLIGQMSPEYLTGSNIPLNEREMFIYECNKVFVELGTSLSILSKVYTPSYYERGLIFYNKYNELFPELFEILPDLGTKIYSSTLFKLDPHFDEIEEPMVFWFTARKYLFEVLNYYLTRYLKIDSNISSNLFFEIMKTQLRKEYYLPLIEFVLRFKLKMDIPPQISKVFNIIFQFYGCILFKNNIRNSQYSYENIGFSCPTINFFYSTLILLDSIDENGSVKEDNLNLLKKIFKLEIKETNKSNIYIWKVIRDHYLVNLHLLPYMY